MGFWAEADGGYNGHKSMENVRPDKMPAKTQSMIDEEDARAKYAQAFGEASSWGPNAGAAGITSPGINQIHESGARAYQADLAAKLQAIANGAGGGVAESAARANLASAGKAQAGYVASRAPAGSIASAMRTTGNTNQAMAAGGEARVAALRAQEQLAAQAALGSTLAGMRSQDFGVANEQAKLAAQASLANAGFTQSAAMANQEAWQKQQALKRAAFGNITDHEQGVFNDRISRRRVLAGDAGWRGQFDMQRLQRSDAQQAAYLNTAAKGIGYIGQAYSEDDTKKASDERVKTDVQPGDEKLVAMLDALLGGE